MAAVLPLAPPPAAMPSPTVDTPRRTAIGPPPPASERGSGVNTRGRTRTILRDIIAGKWWADQV